MAVHDFFSGGNVAITHRALITNGTTGVPYGGTGDPVFAGAHAYHAALFQGTWGDAAGTLFVYGHFNSSGGGTSLLGTTIIGTAQKNVVFDFKTDALTGLGTVNNGTYYNWISAQVTPVTAGTVRGNLSILSYHPRSAGTTPLAAGIDALGTRYV